MSDKLPTVLVHGDGIHDDTDAVEAHYNERAVGYHSDGTRFPGAGRRYLVSRTINITTSGAVFNGRDCQLATPPVEPSAND